MLENIKIIGTSHVAEKSIKEVNQGFEEFSPNIVALELDKRRYLGLLASEDSEIKNENPRIKDVGFKGYLFFLLGRFVQQKIGSKLGIVPGSEMKEAIKLAKINNTKIALIDRDIRLTLKSLSKSITWKEKWNFIKDLINGIFHKGNKIKIDLTTVPDDQMVIKLISMVKERYPGMYKALVEERNEIMAQNIAKIITQAPESKILIIIGAGHKQGLEEELERSLNNQIYIAG